jgi:23S rRNA G2445 N2-methylase RlmL
MESHAEAGLTSRMKNGDRNRDKELYRQLRALPWEQLWTVEAARFNEASPEERVKTVAVIRAVGVVFSESGFVKQKDEVRRWLLGLLHDPSEKARRYAMAALPKIGSEPTDEAELISVLRATSSEREKKYLGRTLEKVGSTATLETLGGMSPDALPRTGQKILARLAREQNPSALRLESLLSDFQGLQINLRGRRGLAGIVRDEVEASGRFRVAASGSGIVGVTPAGPFSLTDLFSLRCFGTAGFVLGNADGTETLASVIASEATRRILRTFTEGAIRYRLNFASKGHQRSTVRQLAARVYELCPELLNDGRDVTWTVDIHETGRGNSVELRPNLTPDPRFHYRKEDVPAASHPQLAACMARLAGRVEHEIIWDPFCGSGLELIESALLGGVEKIYGTDVSSEAIAIAGENFAAARIKDIPFNFVCCDFHDFARGEELASNRVTLIITNPPMGMRVFIPDLKKLMADVFTVAAGALRPGGRLVLCNPLRMERPHPLLKLESRSVMDFGGFDCRMEKYIRVNDSHPRR